MKTIADQILQASLANDMLAVTLFVHQYGSSIAQHIDYETFSQIVQHGHDSIVQMLIGHGVNVNMRHPRTGATVLHKMCIQGNTQKVELLLHLGADTTLLNCVRTPLLDAAYHGHLDCIKLLVEHGANLNYYADDEENAINYVLFSKVENSGVLEYLLANSVECNEDAISMLSSQEKVIPEHRQILKRWGYSSYSYGAL
ncbi:ankyrin repeat domain-containing protein [Paenibacillus campi]|uniref:ankyrin repeat domain-containing protein n=1 Tax=Paenibacillus campi TaxID=3106031 RepID=UPI002AFE12CC|nr:ankyrin repeat domain-containing protein [Paenibacillus sp. SGZ-1009]